MSFVAQPWDRRGGIIIVAECYPLESFLATILEPEPGESHVGFARP